MTYTYEATDATGATDTLRFKIEVVSLVATETEALAGTFTLRGNYPNPFTDITTLVLDVPHTVVLDMMGREVMNVGPKTVSAGTGQELILHGEGLPSGAYLVQVQMRYAEGVQTKTGRIVKVR